MSVNPWCYKTSRGHLVHAPRCHCTAEAHHPRCACNWARYTHVHPVDDLMDHELHPDCPCGPTPKLEPTDHGDRWLLIHYALDGREASEGLPPGVSDA